MALILTTMSKSAMSIKEAWKPILLNLIIALFLLSCSSVNIFRRGHGPFDPGYQWDKSFSEVGNPQVSVFHHDFNQDGVFDYAESIEMFIDSNKDGQCDIEASFWILGGNKYQYFRRWYPFRARIDTDHDRIYDILLRKFQPNGRAGDIIKDRAMVEPIFFNYSKDTNSGINTYGIEHFLPFAIPIVGVILVFKVDRKPAKR